MHSNNTTEPIRRPAFGKFRDDSDPNSSTRLRRRERHLSHAEVQRATLEYLIGGAADVDTVRDPE